MASLFRTNRSPFWYLQFTDPSGRRRCASTGLRADSERDTAQALILRNAKEAQELAMGMDVGTDPWAWVPDFLDSRSTNLRTRQRYHKAWEWISLYLVNSGLTHPNQIRFRHGQDYAHWRTTYVKRSGKSVSNNTARLEAKIFAMILSRAARLELCAANPLVKMELPKDEPKAKRVITQEEFQRILPALEHEPEWMRISFLVAMHTGCRLRETRLQMNLVDFERQTITFPTPKGGASRGFTRPLSAELIPVLLPLRARAYAFEFPFQPSRQWQHFFRRLGILDLSFHCLRVTYVTTLAKEGVPLSVAMRLVNHSSHAVHRIYQRLSVSDVLQYANRIHVMTPATPAAAGATSQNPPGIPAFPKAETYPACSRPAPIRRTRRAPRPSP